MSAYSGLARFYDALTGDVDYDELADFYGRLIAGAGGRTVVDLACGTGTLTQILAGRGLDMIGVDASAEMLAVAAEKTRELENPPLLLCQELSQLDLYGTVDAAICSLDGMNYLPPGSLAEVFRRLGLFIKKGGILVFDLHSPERLRATDGEIFVDEAEDLLCLWRADFYEDDRALVYGMDIFRREGELWQRDCEEHVEYAHEPEYLRYQLENAGFKSICVRDGAVQFDRERLFISAVNEGRFQK